MLSPVNKLLGTPFPLHTIKPLHSPYMRNYKRMAYCVEGDLLETMIMMIVTVKTPIVNESRKRYTHQKSVENRPCNHIHSCIYLFNKCFFTSIMY